MRNVLSASDGTATAEATGGTAPYTWDWYDKPGGSTEPNATGFAPGTYHVEVTDSLGCTDTAEVIITGPTLLTSSIIDTVHILCFGVASGEAEVSASGGTIGLGYTYLWNDPSGETLPRLTNVPAGDYKVYITDSNNCVDSSEVTITEPAEAVNSSITDTTHALCKGDCNGGAIVTPSGGVGNYTYDWYDAPGGITDSTIINLCPGTYNVRTTDGNGCEHISTVILTEPDELTGSTNLTMAKCKSVCDGAIDLTPIGGTPGYSFDWYDFPGTPSTEDLVDVCAGVYNVEIEDGNNCLDTIEVTITEPDSLVGSVLASTNVLCHGDSTGSGLIGAIGGVDPYQYKWYNIPSAPKFDPEQNSLPAGSFHIEIRGSNGCKDTVNLILTEPASPLSSSITDLVHVLCKDDCEGEVEVTAIGGTASYDYEWYDVPGAPTNERVTGLCDGTYHVKIEDLNGCLDTTEVTITEPAKGVTIDITDSLNVKCNGVCEGEAFAVYSDGTGDLVLDWFTAGNQVTDTAFNLCAGANYVEVTDENGCKDTAEVFITEPDSLIISVNTPTLPTCFGDCDGEISVSPSGGTSPYTYDWYDANGTPNTPNANNQCKVLIM